MTSELSKYLNEQSFWIWNNGSRNKSHRKTPPDPKPNPVSNLTLTLPPTPNGVYFSGGFFRVTEIT